MNNDDKRFKLPGSPWFYIVLALVIMVTVNAVTMSRLGGSVQTVDYSTFTEMVEKGQVESVEIGSSIITFTTQGRNPVLPVRPVSDGGHRRPIPGGAAAAVRRVLCRGAGGAFPV